MIIYNPLSSLKENALMEYQLAFKLRKDKNFKEACKHHKKSIRLQPSSIKYTLAYTRTLVLINQADYALEILQKFKYEYGFESVINLAIIKLARKISLERAWGNSLWWLVIETLEEALKSDSNNYKLWFYLGEAYLKFDKYEKSINSLNNSIGLLSENKKLAKSKKFFLIDSFYHLGLCHKRIKNKELSSKYFNKSLKILSILNNEDFDTSDLHIKYQNWDDAICSLENSIELDPDNIKLKYKLADLYYYLCIFDKTIPLFHDCYLQGYKNELSLQKLGVSYEVSKEYSHAEKFYLLATQYNNIKPEVNYRLGLVQYYQNKKKEACYSFLNSIEPNIIEGFFHYYEKLKKQLNGKIDLSSNCIDPVDWWVLGIESEKNNNWSNAVYYYKGAISRSENHSMANFYLLGRALFHLQLFEEAIEVFLMTRINRYNYELLNSSVALSGRSDRKDINYVSFYEDLVVKDNVIMYETFHGDSIGCNPYAIFLKRSLYDSSDDWLHIWVVNNKDLIPREFHNLKNVIFISRESDIYLYYLATAKYFINNTTFPTYFIRKPGQFYLNTWHGTPLKTLGKDDLSQFFSHSNAQRNFLQSTHIISPNNHTTNMLLNSYDLNNIYMGKLSELGYPRIDLTLNTNQEILKNKLGISTNLPIVLYAPTWRGDLKNVKFDLRILKNDIEKIKKLNCYLIFRGHHLIEKNFDLKGLNYQVVSKEIDTNELLSIVDILITDYSSIFFDYLPKNKPVIYYAYDLEEYKKGRGLYFDLEKLPGNVCYESNELIKTLKNYLLKKEIISYHLDDFNFYDDGAATERVIDFFFNNFNNYVVYDGKEINNKNLIIYPGSMRNNGITSSIANLLEEVNHKNINIILSFTPYVLENKEIESEFVRDLNIKYKFIGRGGNLTVSSLESRCFSYALSNGFSVLSKSQKNILKNKYHREWLRVFSYTKQDYLINFSGYDLLWSLLFLNSNSDSRSIIYLHSEMESERVTRYPYLKNIFNLYHSYDALVSVSELMSIKNKNNLSLKYKINKNKFIFVNNFINVNKIKSLSSEKIIANEKYLFNNKEVIFINIGRLSIEKDQEKLIDAYAIIKNKNANTKLIILGTGPLEYKLKEKIEKLELKNHVFLLGFKENPYPYIKASSCFVLSSNHEGQPLVLLESIVLNTPCISTNIPGAQSILKNHHTHLVPNTVLGLVEGMQNFINGMYAPIPYDFEKYQEESLDKFNKQVLKLDCQGQFN